MKYDAKDNREIMNDKSLPYNRVFLFLWSITKDIRY